MPEQPPPKEWKHPRLRQGLLPHAAAANPAADYVELQTVSNFSFLRGASHPEELIEQAAAYGYPAIALTDRHSFAGIVRAHIAAKEAGITFLTGCRIQPYLELPPQRPQASRYVAAGFEKSFDTVLETHPADASPLVAPFYLLLYPTSAQAYGRLCTLLTRGKLRAPKAECYLTLDDIAAHARGLVAVAAVTQLHHPRLLSLLEQTKDIFDCDRLSLNISWTYGPDNTDRLRILRDVAALLSIPLVATNDVYYHLPERRTVQDVLTCIRRTCTLEDAGFSLFQNEERCLKSPAEMARLFSDLPGALRRSVEIAEMARGFSLDELRYEYPHEICPEGIPPLDYLAELTWHGAESRYPKGIPEKVSQQLRHELELIRDLDYAKYFLTVYDIVEFARSRRILCQGRGAAANSAVCYVLGITSVDPDQINLLFERFISKERNEPPDIDIDFEHERREEVIQYIYRKYGRHRAALTGTIISYRARSAVRDVGKVFGLPLETIENIIRLLTRTEAGEITAEELRRRNLDPSDRSVLHTIDVVQAIRGFPRHLSQHVGGFIISEQPLSEIVPIENASMPERTVIEWDKDDIESMGMLKIDVLGLGMLTMIRKCFDFINGGDPSLYSFGNAEPASPLMLHTVPQEDPAVYDMICKADTLGVFQIESRAQMSMLPRLRPRCFYDLVIEVAIVRPGPIQGGMVHPYLRRRNNEEQVDYPSESVREILEPTLGVPIFQEQVMELAVKAAGFTPGEADQLRRAMSSWKKSKGLMKRFGGKLIAGMLENGYTREFALQVFEQIKGFGEYGFPQSHSASFALLVYVSSWLKHYYPASFAAALLNSQPMGFYRPAQIIRDAIEHGVEARPVDINFSAWDCTLEACTNRPAAREGSPHPFPIEHAAVRLGLRMVKGLEQSAAERIAQCVSNRRTSGLGPYSSIVSLWRDSGVSASLFKRLARADAFRSMGLTRQQALWEVRRLRDEPLPLFDSPANRERTDASGLASSNALPPFTPKMQVLKDYETIGLSLKAHPISFLRPELARRGVYTCDELKHDYSLRNGMRIAVAGLVLVRQRPGTASGVVFVSLEDETGLANLIVRPKIFAEYRDIVCDSTILLAAGRIQREREVVHLIVESVHDWSRSLEMESTSRDFK